MRAAINRMKSGKALGPHDIPVELWDCLGLSERAGQWTLQTHCLMQCLRNRGGGYWYCFSRTRVICSTVVTTERENSTKKLWERVFELRLRRPVCIGDV